MHASTTVSTPATFSVWASASSPAADQQLDTRLDALAHTLKVAGVDTVVLACTHYPLVSTALAQRLGPGVALLDTADAVVRQVL